jgi:hypothetical protein
MFDRDRRAMAGDDGGSWRRGSAGRRAHDHGIVTVTRRNAAARQHQIAYRRVGGRVHMVDAERVEGSLRRLCADRKTNVVNRSHGTFVAHSFTVISAANSLIRFAIPAGH